MHLHLTTLLSTTILTASIVLAHPTTTDTNTTTSTPLIKRDHFGYIGSHDHDCRGTLVGARPKLHISKCVKFTPVTQHLGINFGTGFYSFDYVEFFTDEKCTPEAAYPGAGEGVLEKGTGDAAYGCYELRDKDEHFDETVNSVRGCIINVSCK
jgi:hypothetical protein